MGVVRAVWRVRVGDSLRGLDDRCPMHERCGGSARGGCAACVLADAAGRGHIPDADGPLCDGTESYGAIAPCCDCVDDGCGWNVNAARTGNARCAGGTRDDGCGRDAPSDGGVWSGGSSAAACAWPSGGTGRPTQASVLSLCGRGGDCGGGADGCAGGIFSLCAGRADALLLVSVAVEMV